MLGISSLKVQILKFFPFPLESFPAEGCPCWGGSGSAQGGPGDTLISLNSSLFKFWFIISFQTSNTSWMLPSLCPGDAPAPRPEHEVSLGFGYSTQNIPKIQQILEGKEEIWVNGGAMAIPASWAWAWEQFEDHLSATSLIKLIF